MNKDPIDGPAEAAYFVPAGSVGRRALFPGITIEPTAGEALMLSLVRLDDGAAVPTHAHPHEQMGMMISGRMEFTIGGVTRVCEAGDSWRIPGQVPHSARAVDGPAVALDVFHPVRDDYR